MEFPSNVIDAYSSVSSGPAGLGEAILILFVIGLLIYTWHETKDAQA